MVFANNLTSSPLVPAADYILINADKSGNLSTYLSFKSLGDAVCGAGPFAGFSANTLNCSGNRAVQWRVSYPPTFNSDQFSMTCVWMGSKGKGHSNYGKVIQRGAMSKVNLGNNGLPTRIVAEKVPNTTDQFFLKLLDGKKGKDKFLYSSGGKVTSHVTNKTSWKFVKIADPQGST